MKLDMQKALAQIEFENREDNRFHTPYDKEVEFYQSIKMGNVEETLALMKPFGGDGMGVLSEDKMRNFKYHLIITIAFITRYCIEGGMEMEEAYNRSDIYIRRIDKMQTEEEITSIHRELIEAYAKRMRAIRKKTCSILIDEAISQKRRIVFRLFEFFLTENFREIVCLRSR